jgi:hypothetical protein
MPSIVAEFNRWVKIRAGMEQVSDFGDERTLGMCAFCGGSTGTRDHCPSRVFLDKPYPENLPVVPACSTCNSSFSSDEEYLACLISCVISGSTIPEMMPREKIAKTLERKPSLKARIEQAKSQNGEGTVFHPELDRVTSIITKLARGHALYELHEACLNTPSHIEITPITLMNPTEREAFESSGSSNICVWPEVGSRMMQRLATGAGLTENGWINVQPERYRYNAMVAPDVEVRIVIHEYLACRVIWETQ